MFAIHLPCNWRGDAQSLEECDIFVHHEKVRPMNFGGEDADPNSARGAGRLDPAERAGRSEVPFCALLAQVSDCTVQRQIRLREDLGERTLSIQSRTGCCGRKYPRGTSELQGIAPRGLYTPPRVGLRISGGNDGWAAEVC